jgi:predicted amidophosphoribosyltransferase
MHRFKYGNGGILARSFAACMRLPANGTIDAILPVPLYAGRQKTRGYNQSMLLTRVLAKDMMCR